jgi:hypothetical protein
MRFADQLEKVSMASEEVFELLSALHPETI